MEVSDQLRAPAVLLPGKSPAPRTHWIGGRMNSRVGPDTVPAGERIYGNLDTATRTWNLT
jgi:hypothetical protein